ncbi:MAG TPA: anthranilate phosphoribosyltransferase [Stellaceae bacterium]|nr:anthranilate phosphoribosyltransferase [Stellaceae bacterium]
MSTGFKFWLNELAQGKTLSEPEAEQAFDIIMSGDATLPQMGAFLMAMRVRGETVDEITGAARVMRAKALHVAAPADAIDTCGTGGDASGSFNVSTAVALIAASCGVPVAKHGNRAMSSKSGSSDILTALGVNIDIPMEAIEAGLRDIGLGFLMAPRHHAATRHVNPVRVDMGTRTIFNMLGPLSNPAGVKRQLIGVFAPQWVHPFAEVLQRLGSTDCWVVHGEGLDELTTTGTSHVAALKNGEIRSFTLRPEDVGLPAATRADIAGGTPEENAAMMHELLGGKTGPIRDITLLNAGAALIVAGRAEDLVQGMKIAADAIDSGKTAATLKRFIAHTQSALAAS